MPVITALAAGWVFIYAGRTSLYPMLPILQAEFGLSTTQVGVLLSSYWLLFVLGQFPAGAMSDRFGPKWILVASYCLGGVSLLALGTIEASYLGLLILLGLYGLGTGAYFPSEYPVFVRHVPQKTRGTARGFITSGMAIGLALGLIVAGPLYTLVGSWQAPILVMALPAIVLGIVFIRLIPATKPGTFSLIELRFILKNPNFLKLYAASFCSLYGFWVVVTWSPMLLQTERNVGIGQVGWLTSIVAFTALPGGLMMGAVSDRLGRRWVSVLALPVAAVAIWSLGQFTPLFAIIGSLFAYGLFGKLSWQSVEQSWMGDYIALSNPGLAGSLAGVWSVAVLLSSVLSSLITGWIKDITGSLTLAFYIAGGIVLAGSVILILVRDTQVSSVPKSGSNRAEIGNRVA